MSFLKKTGLVVAGLILLFLILVIALPLWMPWVAGPVLRGFDVEFDEYERIGYGRFALKEVGFSQGGIEVRAEKVEGFIPTAWLLAVWGKDAKKEFVSVENWRVEISGEEKERTEKSEEEESEVSVYEIVERVEEIVPYVKTWLPRARLSGGEILAVGRRVEIPELAWREGEISGKAIDPELDEELAVQIFLEERTPFLGKLQAEPFPLEIGFSVEKEKEQISLDGEIVFAKNSILLDAVFPREGLLPSRARLEANDFRLPKEYFEVEGYSEFVASLAADFRDEAFEFELRVDAEPVDEEERLPPVVVEIGAGGDFEKILVRDLEIDSPWLAASLSEPFALDYQGELLTEESVFELAADLSKQPFVEIAGKLEGRVRVSPGSGQFPIVDFDLSVDGVSGFEVELEKIALSGGLEWPELAVRELEVFSEKDLRLIGSGKADFESQRLLEAKFEGGAGSKFVQKWIPEDFDFEQIVLKVEAEGSFTELQHGGRIEMKSVEIPQMRTLDVDLDWEGEMEKRSQFALEMRADRGRLSLAGKTDLKLEDRRADLLLEQFSLERMEEPVLESKNASRVRIAWPEEAPVELSLDQLDWRGPASEIQLAADLAWPERGEAALKLSGISVDLISDFVEVDFEGVTIPSFEISGNWDEGPVVFDAAGEIRLKLEETEELFVEIEAAGEGGELRLPLLLAKSEEEVFARAEAILPVAIRPGGEKILDLDENGELLIRAETAKETRYWKRIEELTGVYLEDPQLEWETSGTLLKPVGKFEAGFSKIRLPQPEEMEEPLPEIVDLHLSMSFDESEIAVKTAELRMEGEQLRANARLPMTVNEWELLIRGEKIPDWRKASAQIEIPDAKVAAFTRFAPEILSPEGSFQVDVRLEPGGLLDGSIVVENVATRPIVPIGALRDGTARLSFEGRKVRVEEISATIGGEKLKIDGEIAVPIEQPFEFALDIRGKNLPLARQTGMVIRGDLDLNVAGRGEEVPLISGDVNLHDSFYFAHIRMMPSGSLTTPSRRPPFFSLEAEPFAQWELDLNLRGPEFLEVRGPIFQGTISADFNLTGTLEEPQAIGAALIETGRIRFPFASMTIDQGEIALRPENPFLPQLFVIASGMAFGYDLQMELSGTGEEPVLEFSSNPPLTSEQVLLIVTTGDLPQDEIQFTTQQRASKFAIYFGQNLLYEITGDDSASDRLLIRSGEQVSEQGRETMVIEYRLTKSWSAVGEYDRFDEYNAGVKWNIYSR